MIADEISQIADDDEDDDLLYQDLSDPAQTFDRSLNNFHSFTNIGQTPATESKASFVSKKIIQKSKNKKFKPRFNH